MQRTGATGSIPISGSIIGGAGVAIEARFNGGDWATIATTESDGSFSGTLTGSEGQGAVEVRVVGQTAIVSVTPIGVGDVFVIAGQSNASGRGTNPQSYSHASLIATEFANNYAWKELADPYDVNTGQVDVVSKDDTAAGSFVPLLATLIMADQGVPVAFVPCAMGSTSITAWLPGADHSDRSTLYGSMNYRITQVGGVRAVLWWQGETDALAAMAEATYNGYLDTLANAIATDQGVALMACKLQNSSGISDANELAINTAIGTAWGDNANVLQGPDLSDIASDDDYHLQADAKLQTAADRWWTALAATIYA